MSDDEASRMVVLGELADHLVADLPNHGAGRVSRTVLTGPKMRAVVIALAEGCELGEHESPPAATLQVVKGHVTVVDRGHQLTLYAGQLAAVPPQRHSVRAHVDSALLLTVALG